MPVEASLLKNQPVEAKQCPLCKHEPLELMMRGLVHRRKWSFSFEWPLLMRFQGHRPYCAVICANCKEIIAWEEPEAFIYMGKDAGGDPIWVAKDTVNELKKDVIIMGDRIKDASIKRKVQDVAASSMNNSLVSSSAGMIDQRWARPDDTVEVVEARKYLKENDPTSKF
jgi:hypothetical protein